MQWESRDLLSTRLHHQGEIMTKHGKKYLAAVAKMDLEKFYDPTEAVKLV